MWRRLAAVLLVSQALIVALAGCEQLPLTPQDIEARQFHGVAGKSVIYIVRDIPDWRDDAATILLDDKASVTTYPGTYYRWEVEPGRHRIAGFAGDSGALSLQTEPDRIYYVQQRVLPFRPFTTSHFEFVNEHAGRSVVMRSTLVP
jgi:hypothetical protein